MTIHPNEAWNLAEGAKAVAFLGRDRCQPERAWTKVTEVFA